MHPQNVYKNGISFTQLGEDCPTFKKCMKNNLKVDFRDPATLRFDTPALIETTKLTVHLVDRELAKSLLCRDFKLDVELPEDRLCPMIPNRLNYILWLKDLLLDTYTPSLSTLDNETRQIIGLDIGTGASAIYPLLACASFKNWSMVGSDIDEKSLLCATANIKHNNLSDRIKIHRSATDENSTLIPLSDMNASQLDFTMCNPPFYSSQEDLLSSAKLKNLPPSSACTGTPTEMVTLGGEVTFVTRMINESTILRQKMRWYTSMLGKLSSVVSIVSVLKEKGIKNWVVGEFVQGEKTRRWVVGWSFHGCRAGDTVGRQPRSAALKNSLPFPTEFKIELEGLQGVKDAVGRILAEMPLGFKWMEEKLPSVETMYFDGEFAGNGRGEANGDVWSRAARRRMQRGEQKKEDGVVFGFDVLLLVGTDVVLGQGSAEHPVAEGEDEMDVEIVDADDKAVLNKTDRGNGRPFVLLRWTRGLDQVVWESFCGMMRRKITEGLVQQP